MGSYISTPIHQNPSSMPPPVRPNINRDLYVKIADFLSTTDIKNLRLVFKEFSEMGGVCMRHPFTFSPILFTAVADKSDIYRFNSFLMNADKVRLPANITDELLADLVNSSELLEVKSLVLDQCRQLTDAGLAYLSGLSNLETLVVYQCRQLTDAGLAHLSGLSNLKKLTLDQCSQLTGAGLAHLSGLSNLETLTLDQCSQLTDAGLAHLSGLSNLKTLTLRKFSQITDVGLAHLSGLSKLKRLTPGWCRGLTKSGLANLISVLSNLEILNLSEWSHLSYADIHRINRENLCIVPAV